MDSLFLLGESLRATIDPLFMAVRNSFHTFLISWLGPIFSAIYSNSGVWISIRPLFVIPIAIAAIWVSIKLIRLIVWGV